MGGVLDHGKRGWGPGGGGWDDSKRADVVQEGESGTVVFPFGLGG